MINDDPDAPITDIIFVKGIEDCPEDYKVVSCLWKLYVVSCFTEYFGDVVPIDPPLPLRSSRPALGERERRN